MLLSTDYARLLTANVIGVFAKCSRTFLTGPNEQDILWGWGGGLHLGHVEVPGPGVKPRPRQQLSHDSDSMDP